MRIGGMDYMKELEDWCFNYKAELVYYKCLKAGKIKLADRIKKKYSIKVYDYRGDDMVMAFRLSLEALGSSPR